MDLSQSIVISLLLCWWSVGVGLLAECASKNLVRAHTLPVSLCKRSLLHSTKELHQVMKFLDSTNTLFISNLGWIL